jgi:hypothetical protein
MAALLHVEKRDPREENECELIHRNNFWIKFDAERQRSSNLSLAEGYNQVKRIIELCSWKRLKEFSEEDWIEYGGKYVGLLVYNMIACHSVNIIAPFPGFNLLSDARKERITILRDVIHRTAAVKRFSDCTPEFYQTLQEWVKFKPDCFTEVKFWDSEGDKLTKILKLCLLQDDAKPHSPLNFECEDATYPPIYWLLLQTAKLFEKRTKKVIEIRIQEPIDEKKKVFGFAGRCDFVMSYEYKGIDVIASVVEAKVPKGQRSTVEETLHGGAAQAFLYAEAIAGTKQRKTVVGMATDYLNWYLFTDTEIEVRFEMVKAKYSSDRILAHEDVQVIAGKLLSLMEFMVNEAEKEVAERG